MFNPTRDQVRAFFLGVWSKYREGAPLAGLETTALEIVVQHPEYHTILTDCEAALMRDWTPEDGETNPFLHLSMHLAIEEQLSIDQPPGIRAAFDRLSLAEGDRHTALHTSMECLGEMIWAAQRSGTPPDGVAYLECLRRRA